MIRKALAALLMMTGLAAGQLDYVLWDQTNFYTYGGTTNTQTEINDSMDPGFTNWLANDAYYNGRAYSNIYFVGAHGSDTNTGRNRNEEFSTITNANAMAAADGVPTIIFVGAGSFPVDDLMPADDVVFTSDSARNTTFFSTGTILDNTNDAITATFQNIGFLWTTGTDNFAIEVDGGALSFFDCAVIANIAATNVNRRVINLDGGTSLWTRCSFIINQTGDNTNNQLNRIFELDGATEATLVGNNFAFTTTDSSDRWRLWDDNSTVADQLIFKDNIIQMDFNGTNCGNSRLFSFLGPGIKNIQNNHFDVSGPGAGNFTGLWLDTGGNTGYVHWIANDMELDKNNFDQTIPVDQDPTDKVEICGGRWDVGDEPTINDADKFRGWIFDDKTHTVMCWSPFIGSASIFQARMSSNPPVSVGFADVPFDNAEFQDEHFGFDPVTGTVTNELAGRLMATYYLDATVADRCQMNIRLATNGTTVAGSQARNYITRNASFNDGGIGKTLYFDCDAGTTITLQGFYNGATAPTYNGFACILTLERK